MRVFILLAAAAVLVITIAEGIPLEGNEDSFPNEEDEQQDSLISAEDENKDKGEDNDEKSQEIIPESRHRHRDRPFNRYPPNFFPPPRPIYPEYLNPYPYPYPYPPYDPYARPSRDPYEPPHWDPYGSTQTPITNPPTTELPTTAPPTSPPIFIVDEDIMSNISFPMNMTVMVGGQNLTLSQVTCLLDFFLHPSADTTLESCINGGTEIETSPEDNNEEDQYPEGNVPEDTIPGNNNNENDNITTSNPEIITEDSNGNEDSTDQFVEEPTSSPEIISEDRNGNENSRDQPVDDPWISEPEMMNPEINNGQGHGILIEPGILPQVSFVSGYPIKNTNPGNQIINDVFGGINNLLGTIISGVNQRPPINYQYPIPYHR